MTMSQLSLLAAPKVLCDRWTMPTGDEIADAVAAHGDLGKGLLGFQRDWIVGAFAPGITRAAMSMGRGGGKTALAAAVAAETVRIGGTLHRPNTTSFLVAASFQQAAIGFDDVLSLLAWTPDSHRVLDSGQAKSVRCRACKAELRAVGSDARRSHGWRFWVTVCDEPAQWENRGAKLWAAINTAQGKVDNDRILAIGTRPDDAGGTHWFEGLLTSEDPADFAALYSAGKDCDLDDETAWLEANPGLPAGLPTRESLAIAARRAHRSPSEMAQFRA